MKNLIALFLVFILCLSLVGCGKDENTNVAEVTPESTEKIETTFTPESVAFPNEIKSGSEEISADTKISLNGSTATVTGSGASVSGSTVTISSAGSYLIEGKLNDGQIIVDTPEEKKVTLILNGASLSSSNYAPLYIKTATKKVEIYTTANSVNLITDGESRSDLATEQEGAIYSKEDLSFEGTGALYVTANYSDGIVSKDSIEILSSDIYINSADDGIRGKDEVIINGGNITLETSGDGIKATNEEESDKGYVSITGGNININSALDGIQAVSNLNIEGGTIKICSGEGSSNASVKDGNANENWGNWGGGGGRPPRPEGNMRSTVPMVNGTTAETDSSSAKGLKSSVDINIKGGNIIIDSSDDAVHSNKNVNISGGVLGISSGDDGIHGDETLNISGGTIRIDKSYEGLEALNITVTGGTARVTASDDGMNAAGGNDGSSISGRPGQNGFAVGNGSIIIKSGYICLDASGDGIDANGYVEMTGGTVFVFGPENGGNGSLDYDSSFTVSGGTLLAVGTMGMAQSVTSNSQGVIATGINGISSKTAVSVTDNSGNAVLTFIPPKSFSHIVYTSPKIISGSSYIFYADTTPTGDGVDGVYTDASFTGGEKLGSLNAK